MTGKIDAGEMDGGCEAFKGFRVGNGRGGSGVPLELTGQSGSRAYQLEDRAVTGGQGFPEGRAQHS